MKEIKGRILIDTNILIYATLKNDKRYEICKNIIINLKDIKRFVSVQNLSEMYPNLTGPKMTIPDTPDIALIKITSIANLPKIQVLPLTFNIQQTALNLCKKYNIVKQQYYDLQLVATMIEYDIPIIITENYNDFKNITEIKAIFPF